MTARKLLKFGLAAAIIALPAAAADYHIATARIGFDFRVGRTNLTAGTYEIEAPSGRSTPVFVLRNRATGKTIAVTAPIPVSDRRGTVDESFARLDFLCAGTECALYRIFPINYGAGWSLPTPKFKNEMGGALEPSELRLATVLIPSRSGD